MIATTVSTARRVKNTMAATANCSNKLRLTASLDRIADAAAVQIDMFASVSKINVKTAVYNNV